MTQPTIAQLRNLTDRAAHGLTADEQQRLRNGIDALHAERADAWQKFVTVAAQRDRLRTRMNALADRWDHEGPPPGNRPLAELRAEISIEPFRTEDPMTDTHGCTIDGQPAMPVLVAEYNQLVTRAVAAEAGLERARTDLGRRADTAPAPDGLAVIGPPPGISLDEARQMRDELLAATRPEQPGPA